MDLSKLTMYERQFYDRICEIEKNMETESDFNEIHNFFKGMWDNYDYKTETRPAIVLSTPAETGTCWFRLRVPLFNLFKHYADEFYFIYTDRFNMNMMKFADIIIQHRASPIHALINDIEGLWPKGFKKPAIIHEVDDNEFDLPDSHPLKPQWIQAGKDKMSKKQIQKSHYVTTTGRVLKMIFSNLNAFDNITIVPNAFRWTQKQWKKLSDEEKENSKPEGAKGKVTIGWAGLTSHFPDLIGMLKIFEEAKNSTKDPTSIHFILSGMPVKDIMTQRTSDGRMVELPTPKEQTYKHKIMYGFDNFKGYIPVLGEDICTFQDVKGLFDYGEFYDQYDINLAYLAEKSKFNKSKSAIKVIEGFAKGAISIWTNFGGYQEFYYHLPEDLKDIATKYMACETEKDFAKNITYWVEHPEERKYWAEKFQNYVLKTFDIEEVNKIRYNLYRQVLKCNI